MDIVFEETGKVNVITLTGMFSRKSYRLLVDKIGRITKPGIKIVLDVSELEIYSGDDVDLLINLNKIVREQNGVLAFVAPHKHTHEMFWGLARRGKILVYKSIDNALDELPGATTPVSESRVEPAPEKPDLSFCPIHGPYDGPACPYPHGESRPQKPLPLDHVDKRSTVSSDLDFDTGDEYEIPTYIPDLHSERDKIKSDNVMETAIDRRPPQKDRVDLSTRAEPMPPPLVLPPHPVMRPDEEEQVYFTAFHPKETAVQSWQSLLVYAHIESALQTVRQEALHAIESAGEAKETGLSKPARIQRGMEISIVPECEGVTFNPERAIFRWFESVHRADFRFMGDSSLAGDAARGHIAIYAGPIIVGTLKLAVLFSDPSVGGKVNKAREEVKSQMYRDEAIFVSYSHRDTEIVKKCRDAYQALGLSVLMDIDDLRSGQRWNDELMRMITRADIFQLFWSQNSMKSKYVKQEWEYALRCKKGEGFIRPVYWEKPMPMPPKELSDIHFAYLPLSKE